MIVLATTPSFAGSILYATAASEQRVDGFCLDRNGGLAPNPNGKSFFTSAPEPRRLLVAEGVITGPVDPEGSRDVLYVALADRVQAFRIMNHGALNPIGSTNSKGSSDLRDLLLSPKKNKLYVSQHRSNRIVAYDIDPTDGRLIDPTEGPPPDNNFSSCAIGRGNSRYLNLAGPPPGASSAAGAFLYATSETNGRIDVYPLDADGNILQVKMVKVDCVPTLDPVKTCDCLPTDPPETCEVQIDPVTHRPIIDKVSTNCKTVDGVAPPVTVPFSSRPGLAQPKSILLDGEMLYVEERADKRLTGFRLKDGLFCDSSEPLQYEDGTSVQCPGFDPLATPKCLERQQKRINQGKDPRQCAASRTERAVWYENVVLFGETLLGTQFARGRVDGYRLRPSTEGLLLPNGAKFISEEDVRMTPVRSTARSVSAIRGECSDTDPARPCACAATDSCAGVLYVAAGLFNRVVAYALSADGAPALVPFSRTDEDKNSYPNDVAVAVLPDACR